MQVTNDEDTFNNSTFPKINYSDREFENCINILPHVLLFEYGIKDYTIEVGNHPQFGKIFFKTKSKQVPFDIFAASFWLLSRYEEYLPHKTDQFNRFHYSTALAYQYDFLTIPLVNKWAEELGKILVLQFPELELEKRSYNFLSTIDIDTAYQYKYKGFARTFAGYAYDTLKRDIKSIRERTAIVLNKKEDPFDCYRFLIETHTEQNTSSLYFFLLGDYGVNDKNHASTDLRFQSLIKHLGDYSEVGIHPSYGSSNNLHQLKVEVSRLGNITHKTVYSSRQHFSILKFPETYNHLLQAGIANDYSMGYTNINGFRASFCFPYRWYSLDDEFATSLMVHPFAITENTLEHYAERKNKEFLELAKPIVDEVKKYGGELVSIFHNNTFTAKMKEQYLRFLEEAKN